VCFESSQIYGSAPHNGVVWLTLLDAHFSSCAFPMYKFMNLLPRRRKCAAFLSRRRNPFRALSSALSFDFCAGFREKYFLADGYK